MTEITLEEFEEYVVHNEFFFINRWVEVIFIF